MRTPKTQYPKTRLYLSATIDVDEKWAGNHSREELAETIKDRLSSSLGFRGQVGELEVSTRKLVKGQTER